MKNTEIEVLHLVERLNIWKKGAERAPHKPLLLLLSLARIAQNKGRMTSFEEIEPDLRRLLIEYGPARKSIHPEFPFWYLQNDHLWELSKTDGLTKRKGSSSPLKTELLSQHIEGGFPEKIYTFLKSHPEALNRAAELLLSQHFPDSIHKDILNDAGLTLTVEAKVGKRDPQFRYKVLQAYERRCAMCDSDLKLGVADITLEAAHIKWHQAGGPCSVNNGLALCSIHHKAFDRGAISIDDSLRIMISVDINGQGGLYDWFVSLNGKQIRRPHSPQLLPNLEYLVWHRKEVFKKPHREWPEW